MVEIRRADSPTEFELVALFVADHATVESNNVYVNGGFWDHIDIPDFPAQDSFTLVAGIKWPSNAFLEEHRVAIEMLDASGKRFPLGIDTALFVRPAPHIQPGEPMIVTLTFPLEVHLERPGDYWLALSIDGEEQGRYRIRAIHAPNLRLPQQAPNGDDAEVE